MSGDVAVGWVLAAISAASAVSFGMVLWIGWHNIRPEVESHAGRLFLRMAASVLALATLHHVADMGAVVWGARPHLQAVTGAALASMGLAASWMLLKHGALLRHLAAAPGLLEYAMRRATANEVALDNLRSELMGDVREAVTDAEGRVRRVESRIVRDADAAELIAKLIASISAASVVVGADGALVVVAANDAFWALSAIPRRRSVRLADALCLEGREAERLVSLFDREGATVEVDAVGAGGVAARVELQTVYLPAERGGRMWLTCRRTTGAVDRRRVTTVRS